MGGIISRVFSTESDLCSELKEVIYNLKHEIIDKQKSWEHDTSPKTIYNTKAHEFYITCLEKRIQLYEKIQNSNRSTLSDEELSWVKEIDSIMKTLYTTTSDSYLKRLALKEDIEEANETDKPLLLLSLESCELSIQHLEYKIAHLNDRLLNSLDETKYNLSIGEILRETILYTTAQNAVLHLIQSVKSKRQATPKDLSNIMLQKLNMHISRCKLNNFTGEEEVTEEIIKQYQKLISDYEEFHNTTYANTNPPPAHFFIEQDLYNRITVMNANFNKAKIFDFDTTIKQLGTRLMNKPTAKPN